MAAPQQLAENRLYTEDEYFAFSQTAEERWEFTPVGPPQADGNGLGRINPVGEPNTLGRIRSMSGGTDDHAAIISNIRSRLGQRACSERLPGLYFRYADTYGRRREHFPRCGRGLWAAPVPRVAKTTL